MRTGLAPLDQARRLVRPVVRTLVRGARSPFPPGAERPVLVHCAHHKVGTVWFQRVLRDVSKQWGLRVVHVHDGETARRADVLVYQHTRSFDRTWFAGTAFKGTHMIRDPRDVVVSGYHYHLRTDEEWALRPRPDLNGRSYQEHLRSLPFDEGLAVEMRRAAAGIIAEMAAWDYGQPEFLELRYEAVLGNEAAAFADVFRHFGFTAEAVAKAVAIADSYTLGKHRAPPGSRGERHTRSGQPGEWTEVFTAEHRSLFKELAGDALVALGYERDLAW